MAHLVKMLAPLFTWFAGLFGFILEYSHPFANQDFVCLFLFYLLVRHLKMHTMNIRGSHVVGFFTNIRSTILAQMHSFDLKHVLARSLAISTTISLNELP